MTDFRGEGEWSVWVGGRDCIAIEFSVINSDGIECFATTMPRADAIELAEALLRQAAE